MSAFVPTIVVKKPDGTQVRMTMEEFKEYKKSLQVSKPASIQEFVSVDTEEEEKVEGVEIEDEEQVEMSSSSQVDDPVVEKDEDEEGEMADNEVLETGDPMPKVVKNDLPMKNEHHELSTTTPVKDIFVDEALYTKTQKHKNTKTQPYLDSSTRVPSIEPTKQNSLKKWTKEDHQSPLEDEMKELKAHESLEILPDKKQDLFTEVLKKIKFSISDDLQSRLHSLITSRIKEVRTDDQFLAYVTRPADAGGLGLDDSQSQELLQTVKDVWHIAGQKKPEKRQTTNKPIELSRPKEVKKAVSKLNVSLPKSKMGEKPVLHDILKPKKTTQNGESPSVEQKKRSVGPVDEIKNFSLVDLRRMGDKPADNFKKILEKFKVLKKDSIVLYLEAVRAWYESPLYRQYQDLLLQAVGSGSKIKDLAVGGDTLAWEEVEGVLKMMKKLK